MCAVARRGLSALRLPMAASWAGSGALGPLSRPLISFLPTGGLALHIVQHSHPDSSEVLVNLASYECFLGLLIKVNISCFAGCVGHGSHRAGVGMRLGLRRGVGSSFSFRLGRLRLIAEEGVLGATRVGSCAAYVTGASV